MGEKGMKLLEDYCRIIGLLLLAFVLIILLSTPSSLLAKSITTIGTELSHASASETPVRTLMDFGSTEHMRAFPRQIGDWRGMDYNASQTAERLGADVMLMRAYSHPNYYQPVFFLILQSMNRSSFHPPPVCYAALGYSIEEEAAEEVLVQNLSWAEGPWWAERDVSFNGTIAVKKLVVVKESEEDGKVTERRVVLYFYVKDNPFASDTVTMVRVSALAPLDGSYDEILMVTKEFMGDTIPCMFELRREEPVLFTLLASGSVMGKVALVALFLPPLALIFYPLVRRIRD
jgi:hypothetical protein